MTDNKELISCKRCGSLVASDVSTCPKCGEKLKEAQYGTTWMTIFTVLFVLKILINIWSEIRDVSACASNNTLSNPIVSAILIIVAIELIYDIVAFIFYIKKTDLGYYLNIGFIFLTVISANVRQFLLQIAQGGYDYSVGRLMYNIPVLVGMLLIWSVPNYIYFRHRRYMFSGMLKDNKVSFPTAHPINTNAISGNQPDRTDSLHKKAATPTKKETQSSVAGITPKNEDSFIDVDIIPADSLRTLKELYDSGILTKEEFTEKKKKLLNI